MPIVLKRVKFNGLALGYSHSLGKKLVEDKTNFYCETYIFPHLALYVLLLVICIL